MSFEIETVLAEIGVSRTELVGWIEQRWVLPKEESGGYLFDEIDLARAKLIVELRHDFDVNDEAMPVILQLLDQVYSLRRALGELESAIEHLPDDARRQLDELLRGSPCSPA